MKEEGSSYQTISRRKFLRLGALGAASLAMSACDSHKEDSSQEQDSLGQLSLRLEQEANLKRKTERVIDEIRQVPINPEKFRANSEDFLIFRKMVNNTGLSYSLTYSGDSFVASVREKSFEDAIILAIAGLDVERSLRYNVKDRYGKDLNVCNKYALDFSRLLLGNDSIGDRYATINVKTLGFVVGEPISIGRRDIQRWQSRGLNEFVANRDTYFPFLHSNNIHWWLEHYGTAYGWRELRNISDFPQDSIGIYCTPNERVNIERQKDPDYQGHMGCIFIYQDNLARTQATRHVLFEFVSDSFLRRVKNGEFVIYTHQYR